MLEKMIDFLQKITLLLMMLIFVALLLGIIIIVILAAIDPNVAAWFVNN